MMYFKEIEFIALDKNDLDEVEQTGKNLDYIIFCSSDLGTQGIYEDDKQFAKVLCDFLRIDEDGDFEGEEAEFNYFTLTKEELSDLIRKVNDTKLSDLELRKFYTDELNRIMKEFDWESDILAVSVGE